LACSRRVRAFIEWKYSNTFPIVLYGEEIPMNLHIEETDQLTTRRSIGPCAALTLTHSSFQKRWASAISPLNIC